MELLSHSEALDHLCQDECVNLATRLFGKKKVFNGVLFTDTPGFYTRLLCSPIVPYGTPGSNFFLNGARVTGVDHRHIRVYGGTMESDGVSWWEQYNRSWDYEVVMEAVFGDDAFELFMKGTGNYKMSGSDQAGRMRDRWLDKLVWLVYSGNRTKYFGEAVTR